MDMFDQVIGDDYFRSSADRRYQMYVERIIMKKYGVQDISIDDVFIWRDAVMGEWFIRITYQQSTF